MRQRYSGLWCRGARRLVKGAVQIAAIEKTAKRRNPWVPVYVCLGLIFGTSCIPQWDVIARIKISDKLVHGVTFGVLGALIWRALDNKKPKWWRAVAAVAISTAYGFSDEIHQEFVKGRRYDGPDVTADAIGASAAAVCAACWETLNNRSSN